MNIYAALSIATIVINSVVILMKLCVCCCKRREERERRERMQEEADRRYTRGIEEERERVRRHGIHMSYINRNLR